MNSLPIFLRLKGQPVILLGDGDAADAKRRMIERAGGVCVDESAPARIAIVALEEDIAAQAAVSRLKARGILVNAVDRPALCDFTLPAIVDRDPVLIAVGTGGASAGLAKAVRQRLEGMLPESLSALALALQSSRALIRARWPDARQRRLAIDDALSSGGPLDPLKNFDASNLTAWLNAKDGEPRSFLRVFQISSGDPDQLTLEQARLLGQADLVIHSVAIAPAILSRARADAARLCSDTVPDPTPPGLVVHLVRAP